jgi:hypothetical protein
MDRIVIGVFDDYGVAEKAIDELMRAGMGADRISVLGSSKKHASSLSPEVHPEHVPEELAKFTAAGAIGGGLIALASLTLPGIGAIVAGGPLLAALSGAAAGSYVGFLAGTFTRMDIDETTAKEYEAQLTQGRVLLGINVSNKEEEQTALKVFDAAGAMNVHERAGKPG